MMRKLNLLTCIALICCVLINPLGALAEAPWFELYLRLLEKNGQMSDGDQAGEFCLIDVDMDGTPELLLTVWDGKKKATYAHIYRYVNGKAVRCPSIKMGPVDNGGAYVHLFRSQTGYAVWMVNTADCRKVEADSRDYVLKAAKNGNILAQEKFRYRMLFSGKTTYYVNKKKTSAKKYTKQCEKWENTHTEILVEDDFYPEMIDTYHTDDKDTLRQYLREAADSFSYARKTILSNLKMG